MSSEATKGQQADVYGQLHPVESDELIAAQRKKFEEELDKMNKDKKKSLLQAQEKCPRLLTESFQLMFLRCEVFNADLAAKRYAQYWDKRVEIFGPVKAFQPLKLNEALSEDHLALESGVINLIEGFHDEMGRAVLYVDPSKRDMSGYSRESLCRAAWYYYHVALEKYELAQKHGFVLVGYPYNLKMSQFDRKFMKLLTDSLKSCLPVRLSAMHICHPPVIFEIIFPIVKIFMGERLRKRIRVHAGKEDKILERLQKYGIQKEGLPKDLGGDFFVDPKGWVEKRRAAEA